MKAPTPKPIAATLQIIRDGKTVRNFKLEADSGLELEIEVNEKLLNKNDIGIVSISTGFYNDMVIIPSLSGNGRKYFKNYRPSIMDSNSQLKRIVECQHN